jgi:hypothetical protein
MKGELDEHSHDGTESGTDFCISVVAESCEGNNDETKTMACRGYARRGCARRSGLRNEDLR